MGDSLSITHYVSLMALGGVERQFRHFVAEASQRMDVKQSAVVCSRRLHPYNREVLDSLVDYRLEKTALGQTLPRHPRVFRRWRHQWIARKQKPDVALLWNRLGQQGRVLDVLGPERCLYWEHGSAWLYGEDEAKRAVLDRLPAVICNSFAAQRMLQIRWGYKGVIRVCPNGVVTEPSTQARSGRHASLRLGVACRLVPIKAVCVALHTVAVLVVRGVETTLDIAGDGPLRNELEALAAHLGIARNVRFLGSVSDMNGFFAGIDVFLHTALREPFGMVAAEAQAAGVPVVCTAVDGLPEVISDHQTGLCVEPTADLARHAALGGHNQGLPPYVYMPGIDRVIEPRVCEPDALADAVSSLVAGDERYAAMSAAAIERVAALFDFRAHVDQVIDAAREYNANATLQNMF